MVKSVYYRPTKIIGIEEGVHFLAIFNNSGLTIYLDNEDTEQIAERGIPIINGDKLVIDKFYGDLYAAAPLVTTQAQAVPLRFIKSQRLAK